LEKGEGPTCFFFKVLKKLLVEDESHTTDLLHLGLSCAVSVYEVGGNGNSQLPTEFFPSEPFQRVPAAVGANDDIKLKVRQRVVRREKFCPPADLCQNRKMI